MKRLSSEQGYSLVDVVVGLALFGFVLLSIYQLYTPTFVLSRHIDEQLVAQQDVRLALDRVARAMHETTSAFGRMRAYTAESGCVGTYEACIGFVTARNAKCSGAFQLIGGGPDWQATIYLWRDTASNELRLRCDPTTTFPSVKWPPPTLAPYMAVGTHIVAASITFRPSGSPNPTALSVVLQEQVSPSSPRYQKGFFSRTIFVPQNR
jgi:type II secretory pathway pseudopilin PulG